ncbi:MAG: GNAT family N-acetyltransferase [Chitinophagales bacterium]|nr:GNAT family N-acetyltransferase [Chitinophagales bacterium]
MNINLQSTLTHKNIQLIPLVKEDFEALYKTASDPKIWEQHPNKNRWQKDAFTNYFEGAIQSKGAFKILDTTDNSIMGSTRFYDYNETEKSVLIGYTFYATKYWGKGINHAVKTMMLNYIFDVVSTVYFHVGAENIRSQISITRLGAEKVKEIEVAYFGEPTKLNFEYKIEKEKWNLIQDNFV